MLEQFLHFIIELPEFWLYFVLFLFAYLENILPPIPGDTVIVFGAYLIGIGKLNFLSAYLLTTIGSIMGFMTMYMLGSIYGHEFLYSRKNKLFPPGMVKRVEYNFQRFGYLIVLGNRFLSGMRSVISLFSGISRLKITKVLTLSLISSLVWNGVLIWSGSKVGENWHIIIDYLKKYNRTVFVLSILLICLIVFWKYVRYRHYSKVTDESDHAQG